MQERYYSLNRYLRETYGQKVYKLSLNGGFSCPNRDGTIGTGGCIFCSQGGSGDFAESSLLPVGRQIEEGKRRVAKKIRDGKYIAYFQAYTNTYGPVEKLERLFSEAIAHEDIVALSIATRPDCLGEEVLSLLSRLNSKKPVWVELGLQTIHERTAERIRRGYKLPVFEQALKELKKRDIAVIAHMILGLPGETKREMEETAAYLGASGIQGIKLQLLHVLEGTDLGEEYKKGMISPLSMEEYIDILLDCMELLPDTVVIHRMTGDGPKKILLAPEWSRDKKKVLGAIQARMEERNFRQGSRLRGAGS